MRMSVRTSRRALASACVCLAALAGTAHADGICQTATGFVFLDRNGDGVRQAYERGIGGVAVSNGEDVVVTDAMGRYELEVDDDTHLFVIKPRGYQVPLNEYSLPRFGRIHKPGGSPDAGFHFPGVGPTGPLAASVDFPLTRVDEPERFQVIVYGDPQPYDLRQVDFFRRAVIDPLVVPGRDGRDGNVHGASFGISLGDLVGDQLELFQHLNEAQGLLNIPWYNVYGNHDMNFMSGESAGTQGDPDLYSDETYERVYGPPNFAFQHGRVHFIILDNIIYQGFSGYTERLIVNWPSGKTRPNTGNYRGGLRDDQLRLIENYLAVVPKDDLVVLAFHIPIEGGGVHRIPEQRRLFEILSSHPNTFSLSGHTHFQRHWFFGAEHGYTPDATGQHHETNPGRFDGPVHHHLNAVTASGSWYNGMLDEYGQPHTQMRCGAPNGHTVVHFDGVRYRTEFRAARRPADFQMSVHMPAELPSDGAADGEIVVNVFNGAEGDAVMMRIVPGIRVNGRPAPATEWSAMTFSPRFDPLYVELVAREKQLPPELTTSWGMPGPEVSHHIWAAPAPSGLPAGTHTLEIRHTDLYGIERLHRHTFRVG